MHTETGNLKALEGERLDSIVDASVDYFGKYGYKGARTSDIARAAGMSKSALFFYFKNKRHLYEYVVDAVYEKAVGWIVDDRFWEIFFLKHTHAMYSSIPWKWLIGWGSKGCATSEYGRSLMRRMMEGYAKREYVDLAAHEYRALAEAVEASLPYEIDCPAMLLCGTRDMAGSCKRYSNEWAKRTAYLSAG